MPIGRFAKNFGHFMCFSLSNSGWVGIFSSEHLEGPWQWCRVFKIFGGGHGEGFSLIILWGVELERAISVKHEYKVILS